MCATCVHVSEPEVFYGSESRATHFTRTANLTLDKAHRMTGEVITRRDMLRVVKEGCRAAGLAEECCNHAFRGTGITVFLHNGVALAAGQDMANHSDPCTTKLYDRR